MQKDRFGIVLPFYAVLAFILAFLGQTTICALLLGFCLLAVADAWVSRQVMQAFFLALFKSVITGVISVLSPLYSLPFIGVVISTIFSGISSILSLIIFIFAIIGIMNVIKNKDAAVPVINGFVDKAYGIVVEKAAPVAAPAPAAEPAPEAPAAESAPEAPAAE